MVKYQLPVALFSALARPVAGPSLVPVRFVRAGKEMKIHFTHEQLPTAKGWDTMAKPGPAPSTSLKDI
jgi:hypothetical protein